MKISLFWLLSLLAIVGVVSFAPSLHYGITYSDDNVLILENREFLNDISNIPKTFADDDFRLAAGGVYYRPLVMSSFILDSQFSPESYTMYHITNIGIHILATWLIFFLLFAIGFERGIAFFFSLVFLVHPATLQAVAWMTGRCDALLTVFLLASFLAFVCFLERKKWRWIIFHHLFFLAALFTKETACVFPIVVLAYLLCVMPKGELQLSLSKVLFSLFPAWFLSLLVWYFFRQHALAPDDPSIVTSGLFSTQHFADVIQNFPAIIPHIGKAVFPFALSPYPILKDMTMWWGAIALGGTVFLFLLLNIFFTKKEKPIRYRFIVFGLLWFLIFLLPTFINPNPEREKAFFENRLYLPLVGIIILFSEFLRSGRYFERLTKVKILLFALIVFIFVGISHQYLPAFSNGLSYWERATEASPHSSFAFNNLGAMRYLSGDTDSAEQAWRTAVSLNPKEEMANANLGLVLMNRGEMEEAEKYLLQEMKYNPDYDHGLFNLALLYLRTERITEGEALLQRLIERNPDYSDANQILMQIKNLKNSLKGE